MYKAGVLVSPEEIKIEKRQEPILDDNEVLVKVKFAGICGTDLAIFSENYRVPLPLVLGHEFSGEIIEVGNKVEKGLKGKRVVGANSISCKIRYGRQL